MGQMSDVASAVDIRPAATVMVVRDAGPPGDEHLEVLMLLRHPASAFAANAWVFPGGAVDEADSHVTTTGGPTDEEASAALGVPSGGLAYFVAAARECFEEAGLLLASPLEPWGDLVAARFARLRRELHAGRRSFVEVLAEEGLQLYLSRMHYVSHWITPPGGTRRFDTRFFVAAAPPGQAATHDASETVESVWTTATTALARHVAGEIHLVYPTIKNLQALARYPSAGAVLSASPAMSVIQTPRPRPRPLRPEPPCPT